MADAKNRQIDKFFCLGDIIGYGSSPLECIEVVKDFDIVLMGNHDFAVKDHKITDKFNFHAKLAIDRNIQDLRKEDLNFLNNLRYMYEENEMTFVHSSPRDPEGWGYISNIEDAMDSFDYFGTDLCFIGHTHHPVIVSDRGQIVSDDKFYFKENNRYVVNVGSVGQPRDGDPRSCYTVLDTKENSVEFIRLEYDIKLTQKKMKSKSFPDFLINRLKEGR